LYAGFLYYSHERAFCSRAGAHHSHARFFYSHSGALYSHARAL
jgi:hypothetical protein